MYAGQIIYSVLSNDGTVGPIVYDGSAANTYRIFPLRTPISADQLPLIIYAGDDEEQTPTMGGSSNLIRQSVKVSSIAADYDGACSMAVGVRSAMLAAKQITIDGSLWVSRIFWQGRSEEEDTLPGTGDDVNIYIVTLDFDIVYRHPS